jgi:hypothetical protein
LSYSPEHRKQFLQGEEQKLQQQLMICQNVKVLLESDGFTKTVGPLIDRMIIDVVGGKIGDVWVGGKLDRAKKEERREFYIGYKQALIDLHERMFFHLQQLPILEERIKLIETEKKETYRVPMMDSPYNPEGK